MKGIYTIIIIGDSMKIVCVGHAAYDITIPVESFIKENTKTRIKNKIECGGGPASNAAYLLGKWGMDTTFLGIVGNDEYGKSIKNEFKKVNVNTDFLELNNQVETTTSFIIANQENGSRTILTNRQPMKMKLVDLPFYPSYILLDGQEYEMSKRLLNQYPKAVTIMDAGHSTLENIDLARQVDYLVCCHEFAYDVTRIPLEEQNYEKIFMKMKENFKGNIIITLEDKGCLYEFEGKIKLMPTIKMKALDSTGAGDIFHGAFVYAIANQMEYEKAILLATIAAALSVTKIGGRNSIFELKEVQEKYHEYC